LTVDTDSGVMVQGPPGKKDSSALVEDILKKAAKYDYPLVLFS